MATSISPIRRADPDTDASLERLRQQVLALVPGEGHTGMMTPDLCFYRHAQPAVIRKAATFGVTLGVVLQGTKALRVDGHELNVDPTRLLVITRETEHEGLAANAGANRPYLGMSVCFGPERVARALLALAEAGGPTTRETMPAFLLPFDAPLVECLQRLLNTLHDPLDRKLVAPLILDEILFRLLRSDAAAAVRSGVSQAADAARILQAMTFIRDNHQRSLSVDDMAHQIAMSASHFAHRFRAVARISPMRYLREVRLARARELLLHRDARAGEVAVQVGFESAAHFTREFKRRYGMTPSGVRRLSDGTSASLP
ncbi:MAG TPA: AraC family transcriptional regulator [Polyangia bacterium]|jgi:AraC-like DNA-binding protein|nr:AraC family transcriptional regulator [Polyangia bacterium]